MDKKSVVSYFPKSSKNLRVLLIGAGNVGCEKLSAIIQNSPNTHITVVAKNISPRFAELSKNISHIEIFQTCYNASFLNNADIVISAINDTQISEQISKDAKAKGKLVNVADKPALCDFYLGAIVNKGNLKLAISTNGKSPTMAKRLREIFTGLLPEEIDETINNLHQIRSQLQGDFATKVQELNNLTKSLLNK